MLLKEFIDYRKLCPVCDSELELKFLTMRSNKIQNEESIHFHYLMNSYNQFRKYYHCFYTLYWNNNFDISFVSFPKDDDRFSPLSLFQDNLTYLKNLKSNKIVNMCLKKCYFYSCDNLSLNFKSAKIENLSVDKEYVIFQLADYYYEIISNCVDKESYLIKNDSQSYIFSRGKKNVSCQYWLDSELGSWKSKKNIFKNLSEIKFLSSLTKDSLKRKIDNMCLFI